MNFPKHSISGRHNAIKFDSLLPAFGNVLPEQLADMPYSPLQRSTYALHLLVQVS